MAQVGGGVLIGQLLHYTGPFARFEFKKDCNPRFFMTRPVPSVLALKVEEEIGRLLKHGFAVKVYYPSFERIRGSKNL